METRDDQGMLPHEPQMMDQTLSSITSFVTTSSNMAFPRPRICRTRLSTLMMLVVCGALIVTLINYAISNEKVAEEAPSNDILDPRYLSRKIAYKKNLVDKFHLDDGGHGPSQMCHVPSLNLETDMNKFAFHEMPALECEADDLFLLENYEVRINRTVLGKKNISKCYFKSIEWESDSGYTYSDPVERKYPGPFEMKVKNEFFYIECYIDKNTSKSEASRSVQEGYENDGLANFRRLLSDGKHHVNHEKPYRDVASNREIGKLIDKQNINDKSMQEIVNNIHNNLDSHNPLAPKDNGHAVQPNGFNQNAGNGNDKNGQTPNKLAKKIEGRNWMKGPRYMGSMGLPDPPFIEKQTPEEQHGSRLIAGSVLSQNQPINGHLSNTLNRDPLQPQKTNALNTDAMRRTDDQETNAQAKQRQNIPQKMDSHIDNSPGFGTNNKPGFNFQNQSQNKIPATNLLKEAESIQPKPESKPKDVQTTPNAVVYSSKEEQNQPNGYDNNVPTDYPSDPAAMYDEDYSYIDSPDFEQFFAQIVPKIDIIKRSRELKLDSTRPRRMNVLIFAMDSMSHMSYQRKMPKTYKYIQTKMDAVVLNGYNIVGDATTAAIIPLTTGCTEMELPEVRKDQPGSTYVDSYPLIWNKYEQDGYATLFTEDKPDISVFNLRLNGFEEIPVDHYMRPFYQAVLSSSLKKNSPSYCTGGKPSHKYMLSYLKDFFHRYPKDIPKFAFAFLNDLSHDNNDPAQYADEDMVSFFKWMELEEHLENTVVVLMGDHGARYSRVRKTTQGKLEERLPMMALAFPQWFQKKFPDAISNLRVNADRLTTPFDVHATLKSILDPRSLKKPAASKAKLRGISLLKKHPLDRTCASAGIDMHWCTCMNWQQVDPENPRVVTAANKLVDHLNELVGKHSDLCAKLKLGKVYDAKLGLPNEKVLKYMKSADGDQRVANFSQELKSDVFYMQVIVETLPGGGHFEATVTISEGGTEYKVAPEISRINMYGNQAHCVAADFPDLRKYCYCALQKPKAKKKHGVRRHPRKSGPRKR